MKSRAPIESEYDSARVAHRERTERLPARHGESRRPDDIAHRTAQQPIAGQPSPQQHHPQRTSCQPPPNANSCNRGLQHSGFLPCRG